MSRPNRSNARKDALAWSEWRAKRREAADEAQELDLRNAAERAEALELAARRRAEAKARAAG